MIADSLGVIYFIDISLHDNFCSLHKAAFNDDKGQPVICSGNVGNVQKCPDDYICKTVVFIGACCPKASEGLHLEIPMSN